jgi:hypothetical protein
MTVLVVLGHPALKADKRRIFKLAIPISEHNNHQIAFAEWSAFDQKNHVGTQKSHPFLVLTPPTLLKPPGGGSLTSWLSNCRFSGFQIEGFAVPHNEPALKEWPPFNQKRHSMSPWSRRFSSLTPPSLLQCFGGALWTPSMRAEDFVELQIAFPSMKHQKVVAEWAPFNQKKDIRCLCRAVPSLH